MTGLTFENVVVRRSGRTLIDGVSLSLQPGQCVGLVGESGSGKSTLAKSAAGLMPADEGRVFAGLLTPAHRRQWAGVVHLVFQDAGQALDPLFSVGQALLEARSSAVAGELEAALRRVGLDASFIQRQIRTLSGGQRQRVGLARALVSPAVFWFLDEPTSALDPRLTSLVLQLVRAEVLAGRGVCLISHDLSVAFDLAQEVFVLYGGRVVEKAPTSALLAPRHPYSQALLAAAEHLTPINGEPWAPGQSLTGCAFAPRCRYVAAACTQRPVLHADGERAVACWSPR